MSETVKIVSAVQETTNASLPEGAMLDEGFMAEARAETMQQKREEVYAALQYADLGGSEKRGDKTSNGVVRGNQQVSLHEVWKKAANT